MRHNMLWNNLIVFIWGINKRILLYFAIWKNDSLLRISQRAFGLNI